MSSTCFEHTVPYLYIQIQGAYKLSKDFVKPYFHKFIHSFSILSDDRSKASSKRMPPYSAMQSLLLQMRISSPVLKVIQ